MVCALTMFGGDSGGSVTFTDGENVIAFDTQKTTVVTVIAIDPITIKKNHGKGKWGYIYSSSWR